MAKITDIERKIDELSGGQFQVLCDDLLSKQGYKKAQKALDDVCSENPFICR